MKKVTKPLGLTVYLTTVISNAQISIDSFRKMVILENIISYTPSRIVGKATKIYLDRLGRVMCDCVIDCQCVKLTLWEQNQEYYIVCQEYLDS